MSETGYFELHLHLEGSLPPAELVRLAEKYGRPEIPRLCLDSDRVRYGRPADFGDFLEVFKAVSSLLRDAADYHAAALALGAALRRSDVRYAEVIVAYGVMRRWGVDPLPVQRALAEAAAEIRDSGGPAVYWLPDSTRQFGADAAWRDLEAALKAGPALGVVGYGLGGEEGSTPLGDFGEIFRTARGEGLGTTLHAGETEGPGSVREAIEIAGVDRIGHATSAARDPDVMRLVKESGVFVELCPGSNVVTGAVAALADHPLRAFLDAGIPCCLNTDDPAIFDLDLQGEYDRAVRQFDLRAEEVASMQRQAAAAAFGASPGPSRA